MRPKASTFILYLTMTATISLLGSSGHYAQDREAKRGDSAVGRIVKEKSKNSLWLEINPCAPEKTMLFFNKPYVIEPTAMVCNGQKLFKVTKK
ncbi:MAG: hypothetical protein MOB07_12675 [Acidobacteria bacterium]|nr:hypothetical protein [Acidobacteriota bacterium]